MISPRPFKATYSHDEQPCPDSPAPQELQNTQTPQFRVQGLGFRVQGLGFRVHRFCRMALGRSSPSATASSKRSRALVTRPF